MCTKLGIFSINLFHDIVSLRFLCFTVFRGIKRRWLVLSQTQFGIMQLRRYFYHFIVVSSHFLYQQMHTLRVASKTFSSVRLITMVLLGKIVFAMDASYWLKQWSFIFELPSRIIQHIFPQNNYFSFLFSISVHLIHRYEVLVKCSLCSLYRSPQCSQCFCFPLFLHRINFQQTISSLLALQLF